MYQYRCTILAWVDGDTCDVEIDLGLRMYHRTRIDTPELTSRDEAERSRARAAAIRAAELAPVGSVHQITTHRADPRDKYGRWLIEIPIVWGGWLTDIASVMIAEGLGRPYHGGAR